MTSTAITKRVHASRAKVYAALLDASAVQQWMVPEGMTSKVHTFEAREGGSFRISLTYDRPGGSGKTTAQTDTFHGRFVKLVPNQRVVQVIEFESDDPRMQGEMTVTYDLRDEGGETQVFARHDGLPPGVSPKDNELGWSMSLGKLAKLVERSSEPPKHS